MGLSKSLKGDQPSTAGMHCDLYARPPGPPSRIHNMSNSRESYAPPPGPPPFRIHNVSNNTEPYAPLPGPPPSYQSSHQQVQDNYAPPPTPSPGREHYVPPLGPPPLKSKNDSSLPDSDREPPPYHDWTIIPDNALLPPPPSLGHDRSPSSNANVSDADRAHDWCRIHPMVRPHQPIEAQYGAVANGDVGMMKPPEYKGDLLMPNTGFWKGSARPGNKDSCLLSSAPLYFAAVDAPTRATKTIYYELRVRSLGRSRGVDESSIALGYCAMPYPTWRMPGWERGSLAIHGDDGRRYVNDTWGGKDFTSPFHVGDTLGLGMSFSVPESIPKYGAPQRKNINVEVFFTRNGEKEEGWNLHEELDASNDLGVDGLDGHFDLYAAVGTFGGVEFDVLFNRQDWLWRPK